MSITYAVHATIEFVRESPEGPGRPESKDEREADLAQHVAAFYDHVTGMDDATITVTVAELESDDDAA